MRLQDIAPVVSGMVVRDIEFQSLGFLESTLPRMLAYLEGERFLELLLCNPYIVGVITTPKLAEAIPQDRSLLLSPAPKEAFYQIHNYLATSTDFYGRSFPSEISSGAFIAPTAYIAPNDVRIGPGVVVEPHVTVMERTVIEAGVILRAGCVVGAQGFEFKQSDGRLRGSGSHGRCSTAQWSGNPVQRHGVPFRLWGFHGDRRGQQDLQQRWDSSQRADREEVPHRRAGTGWGKRDDRRRRVDRSWSGNIHRNHDWRSRQGKHRVGGHTQRAA